MKVIAIDNDNKTNTIDNFFSKFEEFSHNKDLVEQTTRFIKVLLRHPELDTLSTICDMTETGHSFSVSGACRTYTIVFEIKNDTIILKELC